MRWLSMAERLLARLRDDRNGGVLAYVAVSLPLLMAFGALAVDGASAYATRNLLQATADSAALAAASALPDDAGALTRAQAVATENMPVVRYGTVLPTAGVATGRWDPTARTFTAGATPKNAVRAVVGQTAANGNPLALSFARLFGVDAFDVSAEAVATTAGPNCLIVLHPTASEAMNMASNARFDAPGCKLAVDSSDGKALITDSNSSIVVAETCVHGGVSQKGTITPAALTGCDRVADPYAELADPSAGGGCTYASKVTVDGTQTLPGNCVYAGGLEVKSGTAVLGAGVHVFQGPVTVRAGSTVTGTGVTLYMDSTTAAFDLGSNAAFSLSAPTSGPLAGVLLFTARGNTQTHVLRSNTDTKLDGLLYFPDAKLLMRSGSAISPLLGACAQIVANLFQMDSNAAFGMNANYASCGRGYADKLRLVR